MSVTPYWSSSDGRLTIVHGDARDVLPEIEADVLVTDPPYGTGGWRRKERGAGSNPSASLIREVWDDGATDWLSLIDVTAALVFWTAARTRALLDAADAHGLTNHRCLYMRKCDPKPMPADRTRWSVEPIWVLSREGFVLTGGTDVVDVTTPRLGRDREATGHPYQKPITTLLWLIRKVPECVIADPFMGSGTTLAAAMQLGRRCIGIEQDERWCEIAARRLEDPPLLAAVKAEQADLFAEATTP